MGYDISAFFNSSQRMKILIMVLWSAPGTLMVKLTVTAGRVILRQCLVCYVSNKELHLTDRMGEE